jgi:uncharacterized protein with HEPN domain
MSRHDEKTYLLHMRDHAQDAVAFATGRPRSDLDTDKLFFYAICRALEATDEAAFQMPQAFRDSAPRIPWAQIVGLRHRLVHTYDVLNLDILWDISSRTTCRR